MNEDYVSFETATLLKKKLFTEPCTRYYFSDGAMGNAKGFRHRNSSSTNICSAPTQSLAMKWLREVHHIHTEICLYKTSENDVEPKKSRKAPYYTFGVWDSVTGDNIDKRLTNDFIGDTYEEAVEAALKYSLENLI